jgi:CMP-N,N'-diacetyllegionaminic acid synthase
VIRGKRVLAVVPARGGSKGIPLKNLRTVGGRSLIEWVGSVVRDVSEIDRAVVSTDHEGIAEAAERCGIAAPFRRPEDLSGDRVSDFEVLSHALAATEAVDGVTYDIIVMLQPTAPLRTAFHVRETLRVLTDGDWDSVWTLSPTPLPAHPLKQLTVGPDGAMDFHDPAGAAIIARQQLKPVYHRNGLAYAFSRECLVAQRSIKGIRSAAWVVEGEHVSIDTEEDIRFTEEILRSRG